MASDNYAEGKSGKEPEEQYCQFCMRPLPPDVVQCPFCGRAAQKESSTSAFLTIAGLTATLASILTLMATAVGFFIAFSSRVSPTGVWGVDDPPRFQLFTVLTLFNFIGFFMSAIVATNASGKKGFTAAILASAMLSLIGILNLSVLNYGLDYGVFWSFGFGLLVFLLSSTSLILLTVRKQEFKQELRRKQAERQERDLIR